MAWFWQSDDGIWSAVIEANRDAEVEGAFQIPVELPFRTSWTPASYESYNFFFCAEDLGQPSSALVVGFKFGDFVVRGHNSSGRVSADNQ